MSPKTKLIIRIALFFILTFIAIQTFNRFCLFGNNCQPFYFSRYIPRTEGSKSFSIDIAAQNYRSDLDFHSLNPRINTVSNRINQVTFIAQNTSEKTINFQPKLVINPENFSQHFYGISCLCSQSYTLKPQEKIKLTMEFIIKKSVEETSDFKEILPDENLILITYYVK